MSSMRDEQRLKVLEDFVKGALEREAERSRIVEELHSRVSTLERLLNAAARSNAGKDSRRVDA